MIDFFISAQKGGASQIVDWYGFLNSPTIYGGVEWRFHINRGFSPIIFINPHISKSTIDLPAAGRR